MSDDFTVFKGKSIRKVDPVLKVRSGSQAAYLSSEAIREFFMRGDKKCQQVQFLVDQDRSRLGIEWTKENANTYKLDHSQSGDGAGISIEGVLREGFGVSTDDLSTDYDLRLEKDGSKVVADITVLVEDATDDVHCPRCSLRVTENGLEQHISKSHKVNTSEFGPEIEKKLSGGSSVSQQKETTDRVSNEGPAVCTQCEENQAAADGLCSKCRNELNKAVQ